MPEYDIVITGKKHERLFVYGKDAVSLTKHILIVYTLLMLSFDTAADWIVLNGVLYGDVYIRTGRSEYFVHFPETGEVVNVPRNRVKASEVGVYDEDANRQVLFTQWRAKNPGCKHNAGYAKEVRRHITQSSSPAPDLISAELWKSSFSTEAGTYQQSRPPLSEISTFTPSTVPAASVVYPSPHAPMVTRSATNPGALPRAHALIPRQGRSGTPPMNRFGIPPRAFPRDVTLISNISDLFSTIDDRCVGESSPEIPFFHLLPQ